MSNCDQNCESVANLNDYAANLIEYSKRIDAWLNGPQDAVVDIGGVPTPTLRNLVMALKFLTIERWVQEGGGIGIDQDGKMYVDFSLMPTDKFEALLQQIRVPIWLTGDTIFYVNNSHPNASDSLDNSNRGRTPDLPFKTIQAAINHVTNNFNMINFSAYIRIAAGSYNENLTLGEFSRTTGSIIIETYPGHEGQVNINMSGGSGLNCSGGLYYVNNLNLSMRPIYTDAVNPGYPSLIVNRGGDLRLRALQITMTDMSGISSNANATIHVISNYANKITLASSLSGERQMSLKFAKPANKTMNVFVCQYNSSIDFGASNVSQAAATINCEGTASVFLFLENSSFTRIIGALYSGIFNVPSGKSVTGKRYTITNGGKCITHGGGENFFPGSIQGTVQSDTYSFFS